MRPQVIPCVPVLLATVFVRRYVEGALTSFVLLLIPYLALQWAAEIYYLHYWIRYQVKQQNQAATATMLSNISQMNFQTMMNIAKNFKA